MGFERRHLRAMRGYVPGKQLAGADVIKLNTNENAYPPADAVLDALREISGEVLRRYPDPTAEGFRQTAAATHGVAPEQVMAVNGGDELLRLAITTFVEPGEPIGVVEPAYSLVPVLAAVHGSPVFRVQANADWSLPPDLAARMNDAGVKLTLLVNPHAPSGRLTPAADIEAIARELHGVLLLDEAYVDFVDPALEYDAVPLVTRHDHVLVLRTLSKGYSLAGLRFGYGLGATSLIRPMLEKTRDSYNVDAIAQRLARAALEHRPKAAETWARVRAERGRVTAALRRLGFEVPDSQTNFVFARVPGAQSAARLHAVLERAGILVRHFEGARLDDRLRISIGTPEQNDRLIGVLAQHL